MQMNKHILAQSSQIIPTLNELSDKLVGITPQLPAPAIIHISTAKHAAFQPFSRAFKRVY